MTAAPKPRFWDPPSPPVADLIRRGVQGLLDNPAQMLDELFTATAEKNSDLLDLEPRLAEALHVGVRSNFMHWALATLRDPGRPVEPYTGPENFDFARDVVRHGFDETILAGFRAAQNVGVMTANRLAFEQTEDVRELQEFISVVTRSLFAFIDDTLAAIDDMIRRERSELTDANRVARLEALTLILEGAPISAERAADRLRYDLARQHLAAVIWTKDGGSPGGLESVADALARAAGVRRPLIVPASTSSMWIWISGKQAPDTETLRAALEGIAGIHVALGRSDGGIDGFRNSHLDAIATQRLVRRLPVRSTVTTYEDIEVVALVTQDEVRANDFANRTLGRLATAPAELRETLRTYLRQQCNLTKTATVLFAHRNTVTARLDKARDLLPAELDGRTLEIGLALEIDHLLGSERSS
jgi:DNA-binding PucR family transcriptional regulator